MENKYQIALNNLKEYEYYDGEYDTATKPYNEDYSKYSIENNYKKSVDILQELVDLHSEESKYENFAEMLNTIKNKL